MKPPPTTHAASPSTSSLTSPASASSPSAEETPSSSSDAVESPAAKKKSFSQLMTEANALKETGNELFKDKKYAKAASTYRRVFAYTNGLTQADSSIAQYASDIITEAQGTEVNALKRTVFSNLSLCYMRMGNHAKALDCAESALKISPADVKALLRKSQAMSALGRHEGARGVLVEAIKLEPNNKALRDELNGVNEALKADKKEEDAKRSQMFAGKLL